MAVISLTPEQMEHMMKLAGEAGARAALEKLEQERQRERKELSDRRLRNTKLLLRNYRLFKAHVENAVYEAPCDENALEILEDLMTGRSKSIFVDSIKSSVARTATIVNHIDTMLRLYQAYCFASGASDDQRRWRVISGLYISDTRTSIAELAKAEGVVDRTIYKDIDSACETIGALIFGIDGIRKR